MFSTGVSVVVLIVMTRCFVVVGGVDGVPSRLVPCGRSGSVVRSRVADLSSIEVGIGGRTVDDDAGCDSCSCMHTAEPRDRLQLAAVRQNHMRSDRVLRSH